ncbi:MAG: hypothetical protein ACJAZS_000023 [Alteromonas naphthalenivorans]|jgi:hypothetical protein
MVPVFIKNTSFNIRGELKEYLRGAFDYGL